MHAGTAVTVIHIRKSFNGVVKRAFTGTERCVLRLQTAYLKKF